MLRSPDGKRSSEIPTEIEIEIDIVKKVISPLLDNKAYLILYIFPLFTLKSINQQKGFVCNLKALALRKKHISQRFCKADCTFQE